MCGDGLIEPGEGLVVVAEADVGGDKSQRINRAAVVQLLQIHERAARGNGLTRAGVYVGLHIPAPERVVASRMPAIELGERFGKTPLLHISVGNGIGAREVWFHFEDSAELGNDKKTH